MLRFIWHDQKGEMSRDSVNFGQIKRFNVLSWRLAAHWDRLETNVSSQVLASAPEKADVAPEEKQPHHDGDELKQDGAHHHHRWGSPMRLTPWDKWTANTLRTHSGSTPHGHTGSVWSAPFDLLPFILEEWMLSFHGSKRGFSCALHPAATCCLPGHTALRLCPPPYRNLSARPRRQQLKILFGLHAAGVHWPACRCFLRVVCAHLQAGRLLQQQFSTLKLNFTTLYGFYSETMSAKWAAALPIMLLDPVCFLKSPSDSSKQSKKTTQLENRLRLFPRVLIKVFRFITICLPLHVSTWIFAADLKQIIFPRVQAGSSSSRTIEGWVWSSASHTGLSGRTQRALGRRTQWSQL